MSKKDKLLKKLLSGKSDNNIKFDELLQILLSLGFELDIKGSHHMFIREDVVYSPNIQRRAKMAKSYQVKQIRKMIIDNNLVED